MKSLFQMYEIFFKQIKVEQSFKNVEMERS